MLSSTHRSVVALGALPRHGFAWESPAPSAGLTRPVASSFPPVRSCPAAPQCPENSSWRVGEASRGAQALRRPVLALLILAQFPSLPGCLRPRAKQRRWVCEAACTALCVHLVCRCFSECRSASAASIPAPTGEPWRGGWGLEGLCSPLTGAPHWAGTCLIPVPHWVQPLPPRK